MVGFCFIDRIGCVFYLILHTTKEHPYLFPILSGRLGLQETLQKRRMGTVCAALIVPLCS